MSRQLTSKIPKHAKVPSTNFVECVPLFRIYKHFIFKARWPLHTNYRHCLDTSCYHWYSHSDCFSRSFDACATLHDM